MCAAGAAVIVWLYFSWALLLTLVNGAALAFVLRTRAAPGPRPPAAVSSRACDQGAWKVTLVKAEIVTDEPWSGEPPACSRKSRQLSLCSSVPSAKVHGIVCPVKILTGCTVLWFGGPKHRMQISPSWRQLRPVSLRSLQLRGRAWWWLRPKMTRNRQG